MNGICIANKFNTDASVSLFSEKYYNGIRRYHTYNMLSSITIFDNNLVNNRLSDNAKIHCCIVEKYENENEIQNKKARVLETIQSFSNLQEKWDGYDAEKINCNTIKFAKKILMILPDVSNVFPTVDGNIQFQFREGRKKYLQIKVFSNYEISIYKRENGNQIEARIIDINKDVDIKHLQRLVNDFGK